MNTRKNVIALLLLTLSCCLAQISSDDGQEKIRNLLFQLLEDNLLRDTMFEIQQPLQWGITKVKVIKHIDKKDNFIFRRLEFHSVNNCVAVLIKNRDGEFAIDAKERFAFKGIDFEITRIFDNSLSGDNLANEESSKFVITYCNYKGKDCMNISVISAPMDKYISDLKKKSDIDIDIVNKYVNLRTFKREYIIDKGTSVIYAIRCYNFKNQLLRSVERENVDVNPELNKSNLFAVPLNVDGITDDFSAFMNICLYADMKE